MILYMIVKKDGEGADKYRLGGGSSTAAIPRVYHSLPKAQNYLDWLGDKFELLYIDTDVQERYNEL